MSFGKLRFVYGRMAALQTGYQRLTRLQGSDNGDCKGSNCRSFIASPLANLLVDSNFWKNSRAPKDILALTDDLSALSNFLTVLGLISTDLRNDLVGVLRALLFHRVNHLIQESCGICEMCHARFAEVEETV